MTTAWDWDPEATAALVAAVGGRMTEVAGVHPADRLRAALGLGPGQSALALVRGPGAGSTFRLLEAVLIGRSSDAAVLLDDISVSRRHAEVRPGPDGWAVGDLGSLNGTYLNLRRVEQAVLAHGDEIQVGMFRLVFLHEPALRP